MRDDLSRAVLSCEEIELILRKIERCGEGVDGVTAATRNGRVVYDARTLEHLLESPLPHTY